MACHHSHANPNTAVELADWQDLLGIVIGVQNTAVTNPWTQDILEEWLR